MEIDYNVVISNIRFLLNSHETNVERLCRATGMYTGTVAKYMNAQRKPSLEFVITVSQYFNVTLEWLLGLSISQSNQDDDEIQQISRCFSEASDGDKKVVHAILDKYSGIAD